MGNGIVKKTEVKPQVKLSDYFAARIEDTEAYVIERGKERQVAHLLVSDIVPLQENKKFIVSVVYRYASYLRGGIHMEYRASNLIDVTLSNGVAALLDKRTGQPIAQLRYNPSVSPMETMAFLSAVIQDYEKYMKLIEKCYRG